MVTIFFLKIQRLLIDPLTPDSEKHKLIDKAKKVRPRDI